MALKRFVGMEDLKRQVLYIYQRIKLEEERKKIIGINSTLKEGHHFVITGNPGTGKTSVAKALAEVFANMGLTKENKLVVAERKNLVGQYIGLTEKNTREKIEEAIGGVLFIDEACNLYREESPRDFGKEAIVVGLAAYLTGGPFKFIDIRDIKGNTKLTDAVRSGSVGRVVYTIKEKGANPNRKDRDGRAPILLAKDKEMIETLIELGADVNAENNEGLTPLLSFIENSYISDEEENPIFLMLDAGADINKRYKDGKTPLHKLVQMDSDWAIEFINRGADIFAKDNDGCTPLHYAARNGNYEIIQFLVQKGANIDEVDNEGRTPLFYGIENFYVMESIEIVKLFVSLGAGINHLDNYNRNISFYCWRDSLELLKVLNQLGLDFNVRDIEGKTVLFNSGFGIDELKFFIDEVGLDAKHVDNNGRTILHGTNYIGNDKIKYLLDKGLDINALDKDGRSPIFYAKNKKALLEFGADINIIDKYGRTPLYYADAQNIGLLVEAGIDVNTEAEFGQNPLHYIYSNLDEKNLYERTVELIRAGISLYAEDYEGNTPIEVYEKYRQPKRNDRTYNLLERSMKRR